MERYQQLDDVNESTSIAALLLDIEGTTTPIDFVYKTLFPYARSRVKAYFETHLQSDETRRDIAALIEANLEDTRRGLDPPKLENNVDQVSPAAAAAYVHWLMDRDSKSTPLKSIQGKIWESGYNSGDLRSQVFDDVPPALERWREHARRIYIYSSGSVLAQKLLFASTQFGDLTHFIGGHFDTKVGPKKEPASFRRIQEAIALDPPRILFVSDVTDELDAAAAAGLETVLCVRPGNHPQPASEHPEVSSFDEILPWQLEHEPRPW